jgi:tRNA-specific 2-thiouridylase
MTNISEDYSGKKVVIGLTGRMDSCVAALLLKKQGMQVIGVSLVNVSKEDFKDEADAPKCHLSKLEQVKEFCDQLNIPFYATDTKAEFDGEVFDPLVSRKLAAQANNSCFDCTKMRIRVLYEKMVKLKADYIATGHYCKVQKNIHSSQYFIHGNNDLKSDQSFLLAGIPAKYLKHLILPLGELKKAEVEKIAHKFGLKFSPSKEMTEFCFQKKDSFFKKAMQRIPKSMIKEGQIQNAHTELYHGDHDGIVAFFLGQGELPFKGIGPADTDLEIVGYNFGSGLISIGNKSHLTFKAFQIVHLNLGGGLDKSRPMTCFIKNKHSTEYHKCHLYFKNNASALIETAAEVYPVVAGESFVIFDKNTRNAKVIGIGSTGNIGDFELTDRVSEYRSGESEEDIVSVTSSTVFKF